MKPPDSSGSSHGGSSSSLSPPHVDIGQSTWQDFLEIDDWGSAAKKLSRAISDNVGSSNFAPNELLGILFHTAEKKTDMTEQDVFNALRSQEVTPATSGPSLAQHDTGPEAGTEPDAAAQPSSGKSDGVDAGVENDQPNEERENVLEQHLDAVARVFSTETMNFDDVMLLLGNDAFRSHFSSVLDYVQQKLREQSKLLFHTIFPYHQLQTMLFLGLIQIITLPRLLAWIPIALTYLSFGAMVYFSLQMYQRRAILKQIETYQRLLAPFLQSDESSRRDSSSHEHHQPEKADAKASVTHADEKTVEDTAAETKMELLTGDDIGLGEPSGEVSAPTNQPSIPKAFLERPKDLDVPSNDIPSVEQDIPTSKESTQEQPKPTETSTPTTVRVPVKKTLYQFDSMEPYVSFFTALFVFVLSFAICGQSVPNCLFLCSVSLVFCGMSFIALRGDQTLVAFVALLLDALSCGPHLLVKLHSRFSNSIPSSVSSDLFSFRVGQNASLHISLASACFVSIVILYVGLAIGLVLWPAPKGQRRRSILQTIVPQLVALFWWQVAVMLALVGTFEFEFQNVVLTAGLITLVLWPTLASMLFVAAVVLAQLKDSLNYSNIARAAFTLFILFLPFLYKKIKGIVKTATGTSYRRKKTVFLIAFYLALLVMSVSLLYHGPFPIDKGVSNLTWKQYQHRCGAPSSDAVGEDNSIARQIECSQLKGLVVAWKGAVHAVRVTHLHNSLETLLDYLPNHIAEWLRCFYGSGDMGFLSEMNIEPKGCSITSHNVYTFELDVSGPWGESMISSAKSSVSLVASHKFEQMLAKLREGDVVSFIATVDRYQLRPPPKFKLLQLECISCKALETSKQPNQRSAAVIQYYSGFWSHLSYSCKFLFNFLFSPLIVID